MWSLSQLLNSGCSVKAAIDDTEVNEHGYIPNIIYEEKFEFPYNFLM